jgi:hypothetical protein
MRAFWIAGLLGLLVTAGAATAGPLVYHSPGDTGIRPTTPPNLPKASAVTLYLWLDPGSAPLSGTVCNNASGDASCAYDLRVQVQGDSKIVSFTPIGDVVQKLTPPTNSTLLRANRLANTAPIVGKQKIGTLVVNTSGPLGGTIDVTGVHSLGAALQLDPIPSNTLAFVPEPGELVLLVSGLAGLAVLNRLRSRGQGEK